MRFGLVLALVLIYNMINIATQNKFLSAIENDNEDRIHHKLYFVKVVSILANFGLKFIMLDLLRFNKAIKICCIISVKSLKNEHNERR